MADIDDRNERTLFVGNLERSCQEAILYELFLQAGPLNAVKIAKERDGGASKGFAFIEFKHDVSVPYALHLLNGTSLYGRQLAIKFRKGSQHEQNPYQGPPTQVFPKGFPSPFAGPPNVQRTFLPMPSAHIGMPFSQGFRGRSPVPDIYGSPSSQGSTQSFPGSYTDSRPSSRGPYRATPPGSRDQSPRWEGHNRGEVPEHHQRDADRREGQRNRQQLNRSDTYTGHHGREQRHNSQDNDRQHRGRERSRTVDDHQRGFNGGQHYRDRSVEDAHRRNTGSSSHHGYRHQHHR